MGLYSVGEEIYLRSISGFRLFTRARGMSENMERPNKYNINVSVSRRRHYSWGDRKILDFTFSEALNTKFNDFYKSIFALLKSRGQGPSAPISLVRGLFYLCTIFLFYLYSRANIIVE